MPRAASAHGVGTSAQQVKACKLSDMYTAGCKASHAASDHWVGLACEALCVETSAYLQA